MSTPANEPQDPQSPPPEQPRYGQNAPQYGQNAPQYGQNVPPNSQATPQYGQNPAQAPGQYGQSPYGQAPQQYPGSFPVPQQYPMGSKPVVSGRPGTLTAAFWLLIAAGAYALLISLVFLFIPRAAMLTQVEAMVAADPAVQSQLEAAGLKMSDLALVFDMAINFIVVFGIVSAGLFALIAFMLRAGSNGARITGTVLVVLSLLTVTTLVTLPGILLGIVAIILAWLRPSSDYIAHKKASRAVR